MTRGHCLFLVFALPGLIGLSGCSEGEVVPLVPPGNVCERPLDRSWRELNNICKSREPFSTVWPTGGMPVVVGGDGLILECDAEGQWLEKDLSLRDGLLVVAANEDGDLMVAGENGAMASRKNGNWQNMEPLAETIWRDIRANGRQMWMVGDNGSLATGVPGESWQIVDFPDSTDLRSVCAFEDSVYVCGAGGLLSVLVDNQWHDRSLPELENICIRSVVRLDDGRLVVWAYGFWVREIDGWVPIGSVGHHPHGPIKAKNGYLWVGGYSGCSRIDPSLEPWGEKQVGGHGRYQKVASGPDDQVFVVAYHGELTWLSINAEGNTKHLDPAGYLPLKMMYRLADGAVVFPTTNALFKAISTGIEQVDFLTPDVEARLGKNSMIDGNSLDDFYSISGMTLSHILGGEMVLEMDIPGDHGSPRGFRVNREGQVCLAVSRGVLFWTGDQWETWSEENGSMVFLTQFQNFVTVSSDKAVFHRAQGSAAINLGLEPWLVWEPEPGVLGFLSGYLTFTQWRIGAEPDEIIFLDPLPGCTQVNLVALRETTMGVLIVTEGHSMVLKLPDDPYRADWDLVAGSCMNQISDLQVLEDGSLVAFGNANHFIMAYQPSN